MVRLIGMAVGAVFVLVLLLAFVAPRDDAVPDPTLAFREHPRDIHWSWEGPLGLGIFGGFDEQQLQRGFQVYKEVCSACHSISRVAFRNLTDLGFNEAEVRVIADEWQIEVPTLNPDTGEPATRPATPSDAFPSPYPNEVAARAANKNALPPDLSLIVQAREGGADYVASLITGYAPFPASFPEEHIQRELNFNPYFHSLWIAMPPQLSDGQVTYADGQPTPTVEQMGRDVAAFLYWAAEPHLEERRRAGIGTIIFLLIFTGLAYMTYRRVWADIKPSKVGAGTIGPEKDRGL